MNDIETRYTIRDGREQKQTTDPNDAELHARAGWEVTAATGEPDDFGDDA